MFIKLSIFRIHSELIGWNFRFAIICITNRRLYNLFNCPPKQSPHHTRSLVPCQLIRAQYHLFHKLISTHSTDDKSPRYYSASLLPNCPQISINRYQKKLLLPKPLRSNNPITIWNGPSSSSRHRG